MSVKEEKISISDFYSMLNELMESSPELKNSINMIMEGKSSEEVIEATFSEEDKKLIDSNNEEKVEYEELISTCVNYNTTIDRIEEKIEKGEI